MKKVVFLGSKSIGYRCLQELHTRSAELGVEIVAVLGKTTKLDEEAKSISSFCQSNDLKFCDSFTEIKEEVDLIISVQYHRILKEEEFSKATLAVNLHMAPLPDYRGCNQFSFAILDNAVEFGTTIHEISSKIDGGDILFEIRFPINDNTWVKDLHLQTVEASFTLFSSCLPALVHGNYERRDQRSFEGIRPANFHLRKEIAAIKELSLDWPQEKINRHIRATYFPPFPPPYYLVEGNESPLKSSLNLSILLCLAVLSALYLQAV